LPASPRLRTGIDFTARFGGQEFAMPKPDGAVPTPNATCLPGASSTPAEAQVQIARGTCHVLFAYDVGQAIDLEAAERRIAALTQREAVRRKRRAPRFFEYQPPPLRVTQTVQPLTIGAYISSNTADSVIYDFGAISVAFSIPLSGTLADILALSAGIWDQTQLVDYSRGVVEALLKTIEPAVSKPQVSQAVEDYVIYQLDAFTPPQRPADVIAANAACFAQILRAETEPLSKQERDDALAAQLSFGPNDGTVVDWNAALICDPDAYDVRAVLEFANVELLELRFLDDRLDDVVSQAYDALSHRWGRRRGFGAKDLWRIARLQMDSAVLFEGVNNAVKLLGDQYLARVYRSASNRFHLNDWDASILRKLDTIESIYSKIADRQANLRVEVLEWIIIILIAVEIILSVAIGFRPH
jgi:hypothetical protein